MGYQSYVQGKARGKNLASQLARMGFTAEENGEIRDPNGHYTGIKVIDEETIGGIEDWSSAYGFDELIGALHRVKDLAHANLVREGQDGNDYQQHVYHNGRWYKWLQVELCVEEEAERTAREAALQALAPFALPE